MVVAEMKKRGGGASATAPGAQVPPEAPISPTEPSTAEVFAVIQDYLLSNADLAGKVGKVYAWKIKNPDSSWILDLKTGGGSTRPGDGAADCTLEIAESDFLALTQGKADAMKLFTTGKLKITGDVMASQKLEFLRKMDPARGLEVVAKLRGAAAPAGASAPKAAAAAAPAAAAAVNAPKFFEALTKRLADQPALAKEVGAKLTLKVGDHAQTFGSGTAATTLTIADADLPQLAAGNAKSLYQHGKLRVDGDMSVVHRLGMFKGLV